MTPTIEDYAQRVLAHIDEIDGCWRWNGHLSPVRGTGVLYPSGYGQIGQNLIIHRVVWEHLRGPIAAGMTLDHECHNRVRSCPGGPTCLHRRCVNPDHLAPKTIGDNAHSSPTSVTSINAAKTECPQGHPYDDANTYYRPDRFGRYCRICQFEANRRCDARRRSSRAAA